MGHEGMKLPQPFPRSLDPPQAASQPAGHPSQHLDGAWGGVEEGRSRPAPAPQRPPE